VKASRTSLTEIVGVAITAARILAELRDIGRVSGQGASEPSPALLGSRLPRARAIGGD
jgi:hypothetical protein